MSLFRNMRISKKIYLVFTVVLIMLIALSSFGLYQASEINKRVNNLYTQELIPLTLVSKMKGSIYRVRDRVARHMQEPERQADHEAKIIEQVERLQKNEHKYRESRLSKEEAQYFKDFHQVWDKYLDTVNTKVLPLSREHRFDEAEKVLFSEGLTAFREAREAMNGLSGYQIERAKKRHKNAAKAYDEMFILTLLLILSITVLAILAIKFMVLRSLEPLNVMRKTMLNISEDGDFSKRIPISAKDDIGELSISLNKMIEALQESISESNRVMSAVVKGDFSQRINGSFQGDLLTLKEAVNGSTSSVEMMMSEILKIVNALGKGDFSVKMNEAVDPTIRKQVEDSLATMSTVISEVNSILNRMAKGDFSHRIDIEAQGELKDMVENVNESIEQTSTALKEIVVVVSALSQGDLTKSVLGSYEGTYAEVANALNDSLKNVSALILETSNGVHGLIDNVSQISQGSQDLNNRTQQQAAALEETTATMEQIMDAVKQTRDNAQAADELATVARNQADEGAVVMRATIDSMNDISEASHKIEEIIALIDSIAFQTNLLALNAAVEAARAGEHGRGFAVVASEVRSLAGKSSDAARDIKGLIENAVIAVDEGTERAESSDKALQTITEGIRKVSSIVAEISDASAEQSESISQTGLAVSEIDTVTQQNAALVEETSASAEIMKNEVLTLSELVGKFKVSKELVDQTV